MKSWYTQPTVWLPISLAAGALATMLVGFSLFGIPHRGTDEGASAHLFQIWFALEVILISFFALKWLPKTPKQAIRVMSVQILTVIVACSPVFYLHL